MKTINNYLKPNRLLISWQQPDGSGKDDSRTRHIIGEIYEDQFGTYFHYFAGTDQFHAAEIKGFKGLQAFPIIEEPYVSGVMNTFMRRLPPRKREDFKDYLSLHYLPLDFDGSDFSLLAHTGAKLPSDSLEIYPDLSDIKGPFELVIELAGTRYLNVDTQILQLNLPITFELDAHNKFDADAIKAFCSGQHIGFIPKPYSKALRPFISANKIKSTIIKLNGKPDRPLIYIFAEISE